MRINADRLLARLARLSEIGSTPEGGVTRLALSADDIAARALVLSWAEKRGFAGSRDAAGNIFLTRPGDAPERLPVMTGSHLDTQRNGGNLDGIYGVVAGLEVLETFEDQGVCTQSPLRLAIWNNEEGVRFSPVTMGSAVWSGKLGLEALQHQADRDGTTLAQALAQDRLGFANLAEAPLGEDFAHYVELHIEQGPVLEGLGMPLGAVTGIQGVRQFTVEAIGRAAHAGTTPPAMRQDAFLAALALHRQLAALIRDAGENILLTVGRFELSPGTPNTVPSIAAFSIDLRCNDAALLEVAGNAILALSGHEVERCAVHIAELIHSSPVTFDPAIIASIEAAAATEGLAIARLPSGATHDAVNTARLGPTGMIFVPSRGGISHNPAEWTDPVQLAAGCQVLARTLLDLDSTEDARP